jgi:hypothetical protein
MPLLVIVGTVEPNSGGRRLCRGLAADCDCVASKEHRRDGEWCCINTPTYIIQVTVYGTLPSNNLL